MSLIGPFFNAVNDEENIYDISGYIPPGSFSLGVIPSDYIFEELKVIVTQPAPAGTSFCVIDEEENIIIPRGKIIVDRAGASTVNVNKRISVMVKLTAQLSGPQAENGIEMVIIKKIWRIP